MSQKRKPVNCNVQVGDIVRHYPLGNASSERLVVAEAQCFIQGKVVEILPPVNHAEYTGPEGLRSYERGSYIIDVTDISGSPHEYAHLQRGRSMGRPVPPNHDRFLRTEVLYRTNESHTLEAAQAYAKRIRQIAADSREPDFLVLVDTVIAIAEEIPVTDDGPFWRKQMKKFERNVALLNPCPDCNGSGGVLKHFSGAGMQRSCQACAATGIKGFRLLDSEVLETEIVPEIPVPDRPALGLVNGNNLAVHGVDICGCGCIYWEDDRCVSCGATIRMVKADPHSLSRP